MVGQRGNLGRDAGQRVPNDGAPAARRRRVEGETGQRSESRAVEGHWDAEKRMVRVQVRKGARMRSAAFTPLPEGGALFSGLEAVYLAERGELQVLQGDRALRLAEVRQLALGEGAWVYRAYAHFREQGNRVELRQTPEFPVLLHVGCRRGGMDVVVCQGPHLSPDLLCSLASSCRPPLPRATDPGGSLTPSRERELRSEVEVVARDPARPPLRFPSNLTAAERRAVHAAAEAAGVVSQSFGCGERRSVCVFPRGGSTAVLPAAEPVGPCAGAAFTAVDLDAGSRQRLLELLGPRVPAGWTVHANHFTVCMGPLHRAQASQKRGAVLSRLTLGAEVSIRVVCVGSDDEALAAGVVGCPSLNASPHVTVAVAEGVPPARSNRIAEWTFLSREESVVLKGVVVEHPGKGGEAADEDAASDGERAAAEMAEAEFEFGDGSKRSVEHQPRSREPCIAVVDGADLLVLGVGALAAGGALA
eukprot:Hpha_TRINITY_DN26928_c0_g1::TRINITY_DN26928_c0_g1_i1::g.24802::m.24802